MSKSEITAYTFILIGAFFAVQWYIVKKTNFLRESGKPEAPFSWARSQLFMWTFFVIVISVTHWIVNGWGTFELNDTCLVLLGITAASSVASMGIPASRKVSKNKTAYAFKDDHNSHHWFHDILMDENGTPSISRLQHVLFTFVYFVVFIAAFASAGGESLPKFDEQAYLLMGISGGTYVVNKGLTTANDPDANANKVNDQSQQPGNNTIQESPQVKNNEAEG